jgi:hypothetical protein
MTKHVDQDQVFTNNLNMMRKCGMGVNMEQLEYFEYCFHCECEGEIPLTLAEINRKHVEEE